MRRGNPCDTCDDYGYEAVDGKVGIHGLHATMLYLLGLDHEGNPEAHCWHKSCVAPRIG
jgi:hypothetical protein